MTGVSTLSMSLKLSITGTAGGFDLGASCGVGPFTMNLRTGATTPPAPFDPLVGVPYDPATGRGTLVDNNFAVPSASNCGPLNAANGPLSAAFGVPIPPAHRAGVRQYFELAASLAELVNGFVLPPAAEPAPLFRPGGDDATR